MALCCAHMRGLTAWFPDQHVAGGGEFHRATVQEREAYSVFLLQGLAGVVS
jgi:hypothetical protein